MKRCYALSGVYDLRDSMDGMYDHNFYFNNPVDYMANQHDPGFCISTRVATSISRPALARGRTAGRPTKCPPCSRATGSLIIWTTGVHVRRDPSEEITYAVNAVIELSRLTIHTK